MKLTYTLDPHYLAQIGPPGPTFEQVVAMIALLIFGLIAYGWGVCFREIWYAHKGFIRSHYGVWRHRTNPNIKDIP